MKSQKSAKATGAGVSPASATPAHRVSPRDAVEIFADFVPGKSSLEKYGVKFLFDCEICGARMIEHHCKVSCPGCGYIRDCSDP